MNALKQSRLLLNKDSQIIGPLVYLGCQFVFHWPMGKITQTTQDVLTIYFVLKLVIYTHKKTFHFSIHHICVYIYMYMCVFITEPPKEIQ